MALSFFNRCGILSMSDVEHRVEKSFHQGFVLPGRSGGSTPSLVAPSCPFLTLGPRESLRNTPIRTKSNIKPIFKQLFLVWIMLQLHPDCLKLKTNKYEKVQEEYGSYFHNWLGFGTQVWFWSGIIFLPPDMMWCCILKSISLNDHNIYSPPRKLYCLSNLYKVFGNDTKSLGSLRPVRLRHNKAFNTQLTKSSKKVSTGMLQPE